MLPPAEPSLVALCPGALPGLPCAGLGHLPATGDRTPNRTGASSGRMFSLPLLTAGLGTRLLSERASGTRGHRTEVNGGGGSWVLKFQGNAHAVSFAPAVAACRFGSRSPRPEGTASACRLGHGHPLHPRHRSLGHGLHHTSRPRRPRHQAPLEQAER